MIRPDAVRLLESDREPITRDRVAAIKAAFARDGREVPQMQAEEDIGATTTIAPVTSPSRAPVTVSSVRTDETRRSKPSFKLLADFGGTVVEVVIDYAPSEDGKVFVSTDAQGTRHAVLAADLRLIRIVAR